MCQKKSCYGDFNFTAFQVFCDGKSIVGIFYCMMMQMLHGFVCSREHQLFGGCNTEFILTSLLKRLFDFRGERICARLDVWTKENFVWEVQRLHQSWGRLVTSFFFDNISNFILVDRFERFYWLMWHVCIYGFLSLFSIVECILHKPFSHVCLCFYYFFKQASPSYILA